MPGCFKMDQWIVQLISYGSPFFNNDYPGFTAKNAVRRTEMTEQAVTIDNRVPRGSFGRDC